MCRRIALARFRLLGRLFIRTGLRRRLPRARFWSAAFIRLTSLRRVVLWRLRLIFLRLLLLFLDQRLDQIAIELRIGQFWVALQRCIVGLHCFGIFTQLRQCIAPVVIRPCIIDPLEIVQRRRIIARLVVGRRAPLRVVEQLRRQFRLLRVHRLLAALVVALPQAVPAKCIGRMRLRQHDQQQHHQIAPAEGEGAQQHQRQQQPRAFIAPLIAELAIHLDGLASVVFERREQGWIIAVIRAQPPIRAVPLAGQRFETGVVEFGDDDGAAVVLDKAARWVGNRGTGWGADAHHRQTVTGIDQILNGGFKRGRFVAIQAIGHQQYAAVRDTRLLQ